MRFAYVLFIALAAVAMSESLRPVPKVLKSPKYKFDLCGTWRTKCDLSNRQDVVLKIIGNHGLMGKKFEITYNHYSGTECRDDLFSYAERYVLDYVSETEEDGVIELTTKTTGGSVRLSSSRFNGNIVSCDSNEFEDGVFYDVTSLSGCKSGSVDPFESMREEVESSGERYISMVITDDQNDLQIEGMQVESRESSEGCKGVTFTMNIIIIVVVIVAIIVIVLVVLCFMKAIKESKEMPVEETPAVPAPVVAKAAATTTAAPEAAAAPATEATVVVPAAAVEPTPVAAPAPAPEPTPAPAPAPAPEPTPAPAPAPAPANPSSML